MYKYFIAHNNHGKPNPLRKINDASASGGDEKKRKVEVAEANSSSIEDKINKVESQISKVQEEIDVLVNDIKLLEKKKKKDEEEKDTLKSWRNREELLRSEKGNLIIEKTVLEKKLPTASSSSLGTYFIC